MEGHLNSTDPTIGDYPHWCGY